MYNRRQLFGAFAAPVLAGPLALDPAAWARALSAAVDVGRSPGTPQERAQDEAVWFPVQQAYPVDRSLVNLNNGGVCPSPAVVLEAFRRHVEHSNELPAYVLWQLLEPRREGVREAVAAEWGVSPEEIAFTRNASESLQNLQLGVDLLPGDEVLTTTQDYPRMLTAFRQRERRNGIVLKQIQIPVPCDDEDEIVRRFEAAITPKTKLLLMCHVINLTGQVLPVAKVAELARRKDLRLIVDGAHGFAHLDFKLSELNCENYSTSLHKWLCAPHGTGLLYVQKERIGDWWPLMAAEAQNEHDIRKFEEIGTHPAANVLAVCEALAFHQGIGAQNKLARLLYLRDFWAKRLLEHPRVKLNTSLAPGKATGVANVQVEGLDTPALQAWLWNKHKIYTVAIVHQEFHGLRISPNVYTTLPELERFCDAVEQALRDGLPA